MKNIFGFVGIILTVGIVLYLASTQLKSITPGGGSVPADPRSTINLQGVRTDLTQFAKAEQQHLASDGHYVSLSDLHSDTGIPQDSRGPYSYDIDASTTTFKVTATYQGTPPPGVPKTMSIGPEGSISTE
jgi:FlaG/FlaF family flagellin (archaellin)